MRQLASWTTHLSLLVNRMTRNEDEIRQLVLVQDQQMLTFETVQQRMAVLMSSIGSLNLAVLQDDIMNSGEMW